ncbi:hypothetical protein DFP72DRAFT_930557 [Ephemerocybe angulata]|uniref:DUF7137 domain-containing protein n=1 Tax=Ephemerocybe angulata TaxID=980116 RepID=A0A8H6HD18_9AGAR|nr:hypothetical protein DFP72DRAFT_930557 [Tulosesus angulatus]
MADNGNGNNNGGNNNNNGNGNANTSTPASSTTTRLIIPASAPAGEIVFTKPLPTVTSYYKVAQGNLITFGWNMSYILATPTHLTVSAACSGGNTYPVGPTDGIIAGTATQVVWDPYSYQMSNPNTPLPQAVCNLMICDERGFGAVRRAGYLAPNNALQFALYTPQAYTPLASGWKCTICNGAMSTATHPAAISLLVTILICLLSGFHLLRTTNNR